MNIYVVRRISKLKWAGQFVELTTVRTKRFSNGDYEPEGTLGVSIVFY